MLPPATTASAIPPPPPPAVPDVPVQVSPWQRLRDRFAMTTCDYRPQVVRWAQRYTKSPRRFAASWERSMPFLLIVVDELERRGLPGEFAMLPYVESGYEPVSARGDRPAGMWQLMPDTARGEGLVIDADYDGRLDAQASTIAALTLIERYQKQFGDWRLADMAFNSGEFRVKGLLRGRDARTLSAAELGKLTFNQITHDHLDRLLALACVVSDPDRFNVELPEPTPGDRLEMVALQSAMDVRLAARLAGMEPADMKRFNAGYRRNRMAGAGPYRLMMPADRVQRFHGIAQTIPVELWNDWREQRATRTSGIASWAAEAGVPVAVLAAANALAETTTVGPTTRLLLPGRETDTETTDAPSRASVHVVKSGDTLSAIAHRYDVPLAQLKRLNPAVNGKLLRPGARVRVDAASVDAGGAD
jgi:membrane-bound lytic murein transglycosylase D